MEKQICNRNGIKIIGASCSMNNGCTYPQCQTFPVITLYQPWATWIMRGWKLIETRTHNKFAALKGQTILIHAGLTTDSSYYATHCPYLTKEQIFQNPDEMVNGFILGSAFVYDAQMLSSRHSKDALIDCNITTRYGLFLRDINVFEQTLPCKGDMGIWYYDIEKKEKVRKPDNLPKLF